jgi:pilus assembly protein CpaE
VPVAAELDAAGFEVIRAQRPDEVAAVLQARHDVGLGILDGETDFDTSLELHSLLHDGRDVPTLMVLSPRAFEHLTPHAGAGSTEYFTRPYSVESLRWRVEAMLIRAVTFDDGSGPILTDDTVSTDSHARRAIIVGVFNPKGGVGKTTLATNLAMALQLRRDQKVLLVDADTTSGHIATSLGLEQVPSVTDAWEETQTLPRGLAGVAAAHPSGLRVAVLTHTPLAAEVIDPERLADHLAGSRLGFDVIVIDLHPDYGALNQAVFKRCDRILVPVTPDVPAIRAAMQFVDIATQLGLRERLALVVNRANSGVSVADMERTTGMAAFGQIRSGGLTFVRAANEGASVIEKYPREGVALDFEALADHLLDRSPAAAATEKERGLLGLFARRAPGEPVRA